MTAAQIAALTVLGVIAWVGLALCVAVAVGLTIRERDRREAPSSCSKQTPDVERLDTLP